MFIQQLWTLIKDPYQNNPVRIIVEILLLGVIVKYAFERKESSDPVILSQEEAEQLIDEWVPRELGLDDDDEPFPDSNAVKYVLSAFNPFCFGSPVEDSGVQAGGGSLPVETKSRNKEKLDILAETIEKYGVGTCGPRGFYGTIDIHLDLEKKLAETLGTQGVVLYAHSLLAIASVIKCFCKRDDVIFYDHRSSISIRRGIYSSKAKAISYASTADLSVKLALEESVRNKKFIITEGVFEETGETADIAAIVKARNHHKAFLILDESVSIPLLGSTGAVGFFGADPKEVDLRIGSLSTGMGSAGGFCAGTREASDLQRLSSLAYCFSASLPAYLAHAVLLNIEDVVSWEETRTSVQQHLSGSDSSSEECQYTPAIDYPVRKSVKSPKFLPNCTREKNPLVNYAAAEKFRRVFNSSAGGIPFRVRTDRFTPIARIVLHEDHPDNSKAFLDIHRALIQKGVYIRLSEYPETSFLVAFSNGFLLENVSDLAQTILGVISETYSNAF
ncbi:serine palmitoyltransferase [Nematocida major]|uniref:serine palmitoyltransferase n=1 Tax=Nematocida major TaxID=1912982 RepID=UPI002007F566|nr:serine palmitoyltransferase [Nematocida major]KAH9386201.1 serine palmitoyltransferase [Nematocida major]